MRSLLVLLLILCVDVAAAAELTARLDREQITDDETVGLSLVLAGDVGGMPDLSPLAADFDIIDQSHTSRVAFVNGQTSASQEWRLEIAPRRTGLLTVPSLTLGSLATEPLTLTVLEAATASAPSGDQSVRLEVTATPEAPYVQGRVDYVVRLLARVDVDLLQPRLSEPDAEGARIERVGEDRQYSETIGGERYTVIERRYAVFPQRSGPLEIDPPHLVAAVPVERTPPAQGFGQDPFGPIEEFFGAMPGAGGLLVATRQVRVRGTPVTLAVRPQPPGAGEPWLPAESVELSDEWQPEGTRVAVGEAITRTVTITAAGVTSAQLPDLALEAPPSVRLYPDPPQGRDEQGGEVPVALKQTKVALVATEPGQVTLPEIRLPWWDTTSDVPREAIIPARTLEVVASAGGGHSAPSPGPAGAAAPSAGASATGGRSLAAAVPAGVWPGLAAVLAAGWLTTLVLWWRERRRRPPSPDRGDQASPARRPALTRAEARRAVERACRSRGPRDARDALLAWAALVWPDDPPRGLAGLSVRLESDEAAAVLTRLERGLYAEAGPTDWDGEATWAAVGPALAAYEAEGDRVAPEASALPALYPPRVD